MGFHWSLLPPNFFCRIRLHFWCRLVDLAFPHMSQIDGVSIGRVNIGAGLCGMRHSIDRPLDVGGAKKRHAALKGKLYLNP